MEVRAVLDRASERYSPALLPGALGGAVDRQEAQATRTYWRPCWMEEDQPSRAGLRATADRPLEPLQTDPQAVACLW